VSLLAWAAFGLCLIAVLFRFSQEGDVRFLLIALPLLFLIFLIPLLLAKMSRKSYVEADNRYGNKMKPHRIAEITLQKIGEWVEINGNVEKVSFKWLNRPHFQVSDDTGKIRAIIFTSPSENIKTGDDVKVKGIVMRNLFKKEVPVISAISIKKI